MDKVSIARLILCCFLVALAFGQDATTEEGGQDATTEEGECTKDTCENGGTCSDDGKGGKILPCNCPEAYTGKNCETAIDPCETNPCQHEGTCEKKKGIEYECKCPKTHTGKNCETEIDPCKDNPCQHEGTCEKKEGIEYECKCPKTHTGKNCETEIDPCESSPCQNGGTCEKKDGTDYECRCPKTHTGKNCETEIDPCKDNPCLNKGTCEKKEGIEYECKCPKTHTGKNCEAECRCGVPSTGCKITDGTVKTCFCEPKYADKNGTCKQCDCGNYGNCSFQNVTKVCECNKGYEHNEKSGVCAVCDCGNGVCSFLKNGTKTCACNSGHSYNKKTDKCQECLCGNGNCSFTVNGAKFCACEEGHSYNDTEGLCRECNCGTDSEKCYFKNGNKICECNKNFAQKDGTCQDCECGGDKTSKGCTFATGTKTCLCKEKFAQDEDGKCSPCDCGENQKKCSFEGGEKKCTCKDKYADDAGICRACEKDCGDHVTLCKFIDGKAVCTCEFTNTSKYALKNGKCEECRCGSAVATKECSFKELGHNNFTKVCNCENKFALHPDDNVCTECNCGERSTGCNYAGGKVCYCEEFYADNRGTCQACDCGKNYTSCEFINNKKICQCHEGNSQNGNKCEVCDCGSGSEACYFENGVKKCNCTEGYADKGGNCELCNCGYNSDGCSFDGSSKKCKCHEDYAQNNSTCERCSLKKDSCIDGKCVFKNGEPTCECDTGHELIDKHCKPKDPCKSGPCLHGACKATKDLGYNCSCHEGYTGKNCGEITWCKEHGNSLCGEQDCVFNENLKIGFCNCSRHKYFNTETKKCENVDKCAFVTCKKNQRCVEGQCKCIDGYREENKSCVYDSCNKCKKNENCFENEKDPKNPFCKCKSTHYYNGESCFLSICEVPKASQCSQICYHKEDGQGNKDINVKWGCKCYNEFTLENDGKTCKYNKPETKCSKKCEIAGFSFSGQCIIRNGKEECICPPGFQPSSDKTKCVLNKKLCPNWNFNETTNTCICEGNLKLSKDKVTCERAKFCDDPEVVKSCEKLNAYCVNTDEGYECKCRGGMETDPKDEICKSLCDLDNDCSRTGKECEVVANDDGTYGTKCRCPLAFGQDEEICTSFAENSYIISELPISKREYPVDPNTDVTVKAKLLRDIRNSMKTVYPGLKDTSLISCTDSPKELICKVELQFEKKEENDLAKRLQLSEVCVPDEKVKDLCLIPPKLLIVKEDIKKVVKIPTTFCSDIVKNMYCGTLSSCRNNNECYCDAGYRSVFKRNLPGSVAVICEDTNECEGKNNCPDNTECVNTIGSYYCKCKKGFKKPKEKMGENMEACIDLCAEDVCNKGDCAKSGDFSVDCTCKAGYSGSFCSKEDKNYKGAKTQVIVVGCVLAVLLAISLVTLYVFYRRFKQNRYSQDFLPNPRHTESAEMMERRNLRQGVSNKAYQ